MDMLICGSIMCLHQDSNLSVRTNMYIKPGWLSVRLKRSAPCTVVMQLSEKLKQFVWSEILLSESACFCVDMTNVARPAVI